MEGVLLNGCKPTRELYTYRPTFAVMMTTRYTGGDALQLPVEAELPEYNQGTKGRMVLMMVHRHSPSLCEKGNDSGVCATPHIGWSSGHLGRFRMPGH